MYGDCAGKAEWSALGAKIHQAVAKAGEAKGPELTRLRKFAGANAAEDALALAGRFQLGSGRPSSNWWTIACDSSVSSQRAFCVPAAQRFQTCYSPFARGERVVQRLTGFEQGDTTSRQRTSCAATQPSSCFTPYEDRVEEAPRLSPTAGPALLRSACALGEPFFDQQQSKKADEEHCRYQGGVRYLVCFHEQFLSY